jgi:hypothetical protein
MAKFQVNRRLEGEVQQALALVLLPSDCSGFGVFHRHVALPRGITPDGVEPRLVGTFSVGTICSCLRTFLGQSGMG